MNRAEILALPLGRPDKLFVELTSVDATFRKLAKQWHPDRPGGDTEVFAHIQALFQRAKKAAELGNWGLTNVLSIHKDDGSAVQLPYIAARTFSLGVVYICEKHIIFEVNHANEDLVKQYLRMTRSYQFPDTKKSKEFERFIPQHVKTIRTNAQTFISIERKGDLIRLADIIAAGPLEPKQATWIISSMYNIVCWLRFAKIQAFDLSPDSYFVEPTEHVGALLGGWFFAGNESYKPLGAPAHTIAKLPNARNMHPGEMHTQQIRLAARQMFGILSMPQLKSSPLPDPIKAWLYSAPERDVVKGYANWHTVAEKAWGARRFTKWTLSSNDVYN